MDPRSGHPDRRTFNLNTAPNSAFQENRLVCSPTNGFLTSQKVIVKSGFLKKRVVPEKIRTIAVGAKIHQSAVDRRNEASNNYNLKNLPEDFEGVF